MFIGTDILLAILIGLGIGVTFKYEKEVASPDAWSPTSHRQILRECGRQCGKQQLRQYDSSRGECTCYKSKKYRRYR